MDCESSEGGISDSLRTKTSTVWTHSDGIISTGVREVRSSGEGGCRPSSEGGNRGSKIQPRRFLQSPFCSAEGIRRLASCIGRFSSESIRYPDSLQHGVTQVGLADHSARRLDVDNGHEGRVLPCTNSSGLKKVPPLCLSRQDFPVQSPLFRSQHSSDGVHKSLSTVGEVAETKRSKNSPLPGRLVDISPVKRTSPESKGHSSRVLTKVGNNPKPGKVSAGSSSAKNLSRYRYRFSKVFRFSHNQESRQICIVNKRCNDERPFVSKDMDVHNRTHGLSGEVCSFRPDQDETLSVLAESELVERDRRRFDHDISSSSPEEVAEVVVGQTKTPIRDVFEGSKSGFDSSLRRFVSRLGSDSGSSGDIRSLVSRGKKATYKCFGVKGDLSKPTEMVVSSQEKICGDLIGQHDSSSLYPQTRGNKVRSVMSSGLGSSSVGRTKCGNVDDAIYSRERQCLSRPIESTRPYNPYGVDSKYRDMSRSLESVGDSFSRPIRHQEELPSPKILLSSNRRPSDRYRLPTSQMGQPVPLCIPSVCVDSRGNKQIDKLDQHGSHSNRTMVATEGMASRSVPSVHTTSSTSPSSSRSIEAAPCGDLSPRASQFKSDRLETVKLLVKERGFSQRAAEVIASCRRRSSDILYQSRWEFFHKWCLDRGFSVSNPPVNVIADFLIFLSDNLKLSVSSIKGYRSVLSSVYRHVGLDLSLNQDLRDLVRHFEIKAPPKNSNLVPWNLDVVLKYLMSDNFEPMDSLDLKKLTQKTLFLISLASAKRVSEIQGLSFKVGTQGDNFILSYRPSFRAKTETLKNPLPRSFTLKNLSELVGRESERALCPVRALKFYLNRTKGLSNRSNSLFCSYRKPSKAMTKNGISFFLRDIIKKAHCWISEDMYSSLKVRAHDIRGVATSVRFQKNMSIADIIQSATWRCASTFSNFYLKDVAIVYDDILALGPVIAADQIVTV